MPAMDIYGIDFSSAPTPRKPVVVAQGRLEGARATLLRLHTLPSLAAFGQWLHTPGPWVGGFDLPFGLPRELVQALGWPQDWAPLMQHYAGLTRPQIRETFAAFCNGRPVGGKFAHRAVDKPAGSSPSMKWVNPPVAYMLHAGVPLLLQAGVHLPGHQAEPPQAEGARVALEAYPGLLARELVGARSYKSDDRAKHTPERLIARKDIVEALEQGRTRLGLRLKLSHAQRDTLAADASGDTLDAVLCMLQAAWATRQPAWGLPPQFDPVEGWIVSVPHAPPAAAPAGAVAEPAVRPRRARAAAPAPGPVKKPSPVKA